MRSLLDAGISVAEVARRTGIPYTVVRQQRFGPHDLSVTATGPNERATPDGSDLQASTKDEVLRLLAAGWSRAEVARRLDVSRGTVTYHARRVGMPIDDRAARRYDWNLIQAYYDEGHSVRECQHHFGFSSVSWTAAVRRGDAVARPTAMSIEQLLRGSRNRTHLKRRLIKAGLLLTVCAECRITTWRGRPLALELHHINGDGDDNRLENLALLCPNCHSQTDSWGGRNNRRAAIEPPAVRSVRSMR
jgi:transcriptional regulator with XRE-family HTH domain